MAELTRKPISWFKTKPQVRTEFDDAEDRRLGESLLVKQLQPVLAKPDGTVIAGGRRLRGAGLVGKSDLEVIITDEPLSDTQVRLIQLTENLQRACLKDAEKWAACEELLRLNPSWNNRDLAGHLKLDPSHVTRLLCPSKLIPAALEAFKTGKIALSSAYELSKAAAEDQEQLLAGLLNGATREQVIRGRKKPTDGVKTATLKIDMGSGWVISIKGGAFTLSQAADLLQRASKRQRKEAPTASL